MTSEPIRKKALTAAQLTRLEKAISDLNSDVAIKAIIEILEAPYPRGRRALLLRIRAFCYISMLGEKAQTTAPALLRVLSDLKNPLSELAGFALSEIGQHKEAIPQLLLLLKSESYLLRASAVRALGKYVQDGDITVESLTTALSTEIFRTVRADIVAALSNIKSRACLPALRHAALDPYESVRKAAKEGIKQIQLTRGENEKQ